MSVKRVERTDGKRFVLSERARPPAAYAQVVRFTTGRLMEPIQDTTGVQLSSQFILWLSILATGGLVLMWAVFWLAVVRSKESVREILLSTMFFRTVAVMGVIAATVVLSLAGRLEGNITGAILSGIVGYVLGQLSGRPRGRVEGESHS